VPWHGSRARQGVGEGVVELTHLLGRGGFRGPVAQQPQPDPAAEAVVHRAEFDQRGQGQIGGRSDTWHLMISCVDERT
jgi:hypothetical protein